jgi:cyclopropane fatty-acyl-phospholipid synthase-like methyltransferase
MSHFDVYGRMAASGVAEVLQNGRYMSQKEAEQFVPADIIRKLRVNPLDSFLDVGCGLGLNLIPVGKIAKSAMACDHPNVIRLLKQKTLPPSIEFFEGDFLSFETDRKFTKILSYSVLPALPSVEVVFAFVDKALGLVSRDGRILLGDISNVDKKSRFTSSTRGKEFQKEWEVLNRNSETEDVSIYQTESDTAVTFCDALVLKMVEHIRRKGFNAYVLNQPQNLPFGNTREDILVVGPEYEDRVP